MKNTVMISPNLGYCQKIFVTYTGLDGNERANVVEFQWLHSMQRCKSKKLVLTKKFPFIGIEVKGYTDVVLNFGTDMMPKWKHLYALESPAAMARKFGIEYNDTTASLIKDQLEYENL